MNNKLMTKPWGYHVVLYKEPEFKVKKLIIKSGHKLSEQKHNHRAEIWTLVQGKGMLYRGIDDNPMIATAIAKDIPVFIAIGMWHTVENISDEDLIIVEVQAGDYLEEDDIERRADNYGRCN